jgi:Raf kinase inhibitor-like YbhB/YbcL family protein
MTIQSPAFKNGQPIPLKYTCDGENFNPPLIFSNIPFGTNSLVLIMDDPDSPTKDFTHWVMFNIDSNFTGIDENFISSNVTFGKNDFGNNDYEGPCPQTGTHKYSIRLYALNTILLLQSGALKSEVMDNMKGHIIEETETTGTYKKQ